MVIIETLGLIVVLVLALGAEFLNGATDAGNAIATVVSTRVMRPTHAVMMAAVLNCAGAFAGTKVALTIAQGLSGARVARSTPRPSASRSSSRPSGRTRAVAAISRAVRMRSSCSSSSGPQDMRVVAMAPIWILSPWSV